MIGTTTHQLPPTHRLWDRFGSSTSRFLGGVGSSQLRASWPLAFHDAGWFHCPIVIDSPFIQRFFLHCFVRNLRCQNFLAQGVCPFEFQVARLRRVGVRKIPAAGECNSNSAQNFRLLSQKVRKVSWPESRNHESGCYPGFKGTDRDCHACHGSSATANS